MTFMGFHEMGAKRDAGMGLEDTEEDTGLNTKQDQNKIQNRI